jgi:hypothetical protein
MTRFLTFDDPLLARIDVWLEGRASRDAGRRVRSASAARYGSLFRSGSLAKAV